MQIVLGLLVAIAAVSATAQDISLVNVVFMNHLDVGFSGGYYNPELLGFSKQVIDLYFQRYFPLAVQVAEDMRASGSGDAFVYTTKSWLVSMYLDCPIGMGFRCPDEAARTAFIAAINRGDIIWHAYPFNTEIESMDESLADFAVQLTHDLDDQFGLKRKQVFSQRDVPGTTRASIPLLRKRGIQALSFGINGASAPVAVPPMFIWEHVNTITNDVETILVMYHAGGYGGITRNDCHMITGFGEALCIYFKSDNEGPPSVLEVEQVYSALRREFPGAAIKATSFDQFVDQFYASGIMSSLLTVREEIGDTWIHGLASDPLQSAQFRTIMRERRDCLAVGECSLTDPVFYNFSRLLLKAAEHTHGGDVKRFLEAEGSNPAPDYFYWSNEEYAAHRNDPKFVELRESWNEQRDWSIHFPIEALGSHPLASTLRSALNTIGRAQRPDLSGFEVLPTNELVKYSGWIVGFDNSSGAVNYLERESTRQVLASPTNLLGLFQYQTLDEDAYMNEFLAEYMYCNFLSDCRWALFDFSKYNLSTANPERAIWRPQLTQLYQRTTSNELTIIAQLVLPDVTVIKYGGPASIYVQLVIPSNDGALEWTLMWFDKTATRIPEALWLSFNPVGADAPWRVSKLNQIVDLGSVRVNGSAHLHAVDDGGVFTPASVGLRFVALDTPLTSFGILSPFPTPLTPPLWAEGVSFNIYNNIWGTNYVQAYPFVDIDKDAAFRFQMHYNPAKI